jgi:hypothetical protein
VKRTLRKLTAELSQVNAHIQVRTAGAGPLQEQMELLDPGSFSVFMSGIKSDITAFVHGDLRRQFIDYYTLNGGEARESSVDMGGAVSDESIHFEVHIRMTFGRDLPSGLRQDSATALLSSCFHFVAAAVTRAEANLESAAIPAAQSRSGRLQAVDLPPEVVQQLLGRQASQGAPAQVSILARSASDDSGPGQYL